MRRTTFALAPLGVLLAGLALPAVAATSWTFTSGGCTSNCTGSGPGAAGVKVTAGAYSDTNGVDGSSSRTIETAYLGSYSGGLGVTNRDNSCANQPDQASCNQSSSYRTQYLDYQEGNDPEHSMDNNERYDSILFSFSEAIKLETISVGWSSNDADMSVLAYKPTGAQSATPTLTGKTYGDLLNSGWTLVGNYCDVQDSAPSGSAGSAVVNPLSLVSSYWLVMAYNDVFKSGGCVDASPGSIAGDGCSHSTSSYDNMKISVLTGSTRPDDGSPPTNAPEPGSMLLFGAGLAGLALARRRKAAA